MSSLPDARKWRKFVNFCEITEFCVSFLCTLPRCSRCCFSDLELAKVEIVRINLSVS